jgi:hypothetical protein
MEHRDLLKLQQLGGRETLAFTHNLKFVKKNGKILCLRRRSCRSPRRISPSSAPTILRRRSRSASPRPPNVGQWL